MSGVSPKIKKQYRAESTEQLVKMESEFRLALFRLRMAHSAGDSQAHRSAMFSTLRRNIALIKTILHERKITESAGA